MLRLMVYLGFLISTFSSILSQPDYDMHDAFKINNKDLLFIARDIGSGFRLLLIHFLTFVFLTKNESLIFNSRVDDQVLLVGVDIADFSAVGVRWLLLLDDLGSELLPELANVQWLKGRGSGLHDAATTSLRSEKSLFIIILVL
jgi:hypothetical protein